MPAAMPPHFSSTTTTTISANAAPSSSTMRTRSLHALTTTFSSPFVASRRALGHRRHFSRSSRSHSRSPTSPDSSWASPSSSVSSAASFHTFGTPYAPRLSSSSNHHKHNHTKVPFGAGTSVVPLLPPAELSNDVEMLEQQRRCIRRPSLLDLEEERQVCGNGLVEMLEPREVRWFGGLDGMLA